MSSLIKVLLFLFIFQVVCFAEENNYNNFEGLWCIDAQDKLIDDFLIIKKIDNNYLVITAFTDDDKSQKSIAVLKNKNILEVVLRGKKYTLKWDRDGDEEWIEMFIKS